MSGQSSTNPPRSPQTPRPATQAVSSFVLYAAGTVLLLALVNLLGGDAGLSGCV